MKAVLVNAAPRFQRSIRRPKYPFAVRAKPWALTPIHIQPVLPGETMKNLDAQMRVVSDPLKSKMAGWWCETFWFYCPHQSLDQREELINMHLTGTALTTDRETAQDLPWYTFDNGINWLSACTKRVTEEYFRDEGEAWNTNLIGSYPAVQAFPDNSWTDSLIDDATAPPAVNELQNDPDLTVMATYATQYARMIQARETNMTYKDWLALHGVRDQPTIDEKGHIYKPELVRYTREFGYPVNTVEPTTGVPSSAAVFSAQVRADKDRRFKEPGFLVGYLVLRPKVFRSSQKGLALGGLDEARLWLPSLFSDEPYTSIKKFENTDVAGEGPLATVPTNDYWMDMRDLFIYGDQFVNFDITAADDPHTPGIALPTAALQDKYPTEAMANALFSGSTAATQLIRVDGIVQAEIAGTRVGPDQT